LHIFYSVIIIPQKRAKIHAKCLPWEGSLAYFGREYAPQKIFYEYFGMPCSYFFIFINRRWAMTATKRPKDVQV
jgi:hypothetical protein